MTLDTKTFPDPPTSLSVAIRLAVGDARSLDRLLYVPEHHQWHNPGYGNGLCRVCDAGAVIAGTLGVDPSERVSYEAGGDRWRNTLLSLDAVRVGDFRTAVNLFDGPGDLIAEDPHRPSVKCGLFLGWAQFDEHLESLEEVASWLEERGL